MRVYTAHAPRPDYRGEAAQAEGTIFVRDGFSFWALLFPLIWFLINRMWLVTLGYVVYTAIVIGLIELYPGAELPLGAASILIAIWIGFEANGLHRWSLRRKGYVDRGVVAARNLTEAEIRHFDKLARGEIVDAPFVPPAPAAASAPAWGEDEREVVGLFPQPER